MEDELVAFILLAIVVKAICDVVEEYLVGVHTPSDSSESDLRQSTVSQHLCKTCSPDVHVLSTWSLLLTLWARCWFTDILYKLYL